MEVTVDFPKACFIKTFPRHIHVMLAAADITAIIDGTDFKFIPIHSNEIRINRKTKQIENKDELYAFQKGTDIINLTMTELISIPGFLPQLHRLVESYFHKPRVEEEMRRQETEELIELLEKDNIKRLINIALDERDEPAFMELSRLLQ
ncbi:IDEAL domain-containing protein [Virgibacillus sediminis]|uniref:IDEAL domain-containing protein n=1 Tax=Virgibacillus sediminis TaxID=202260 RepID=A0ABV7A2V2_9BACI